MKITIHKKFVLGQKGKPLDVKTEIPVLEDLLKTVEKEERYEMAAVIYKRLKTVRSPGSLGRS
ncbi:MAG TPA: hypothetical protein VN026_12415 [Bacteroidia bacterium]|jgi:hypothetical protein|nr:hypothetical protein [Bacteroidia bacterium]